MVGPESEEPITDRVTYRRNEVRGGDGCGVQLYASVVLVVRLEQQFGTYIEPVGRYPFP